MIRNLRLLMELAWGSFLKVEFLRVSGPLVWTHPDDFFPVGAWQPGQHRGVVGGPVSFQIPFQVKTYYSRMRPLLAGWGLSSVKDFFTPFLAPEVAC